MVNHPDAISRHNRTASSFEDLANDGAFGGESYQLEACFSCAPEAFEDSCILVGELQKLILSNLAPLKVGAFRARGVSPTVNWGVVPSYPLF